VVVPVEIEAAGLSVRDAYQLMTATILPRPIAWAGTRSADGADNLAPFSYFMGVGSKPPSLAISVAKARTPDGGLRLKDTARNILETGAFTVSLVAVPDGPVMVQTSLDWPTEESEFEAVGLVAMPAARVAACYPSVARAVMECRLLHHLDLGSTTLFVGEVLLFRYADGVLGADGLPQVHALDPLARLGGTAYTTLGQVLNLPPGQRG
jgi:flavin reductase (DIM6/NTAB) family NADH-FMN oxidoreductase RutF